MLLGVSWKARPMDSGTLNRMMTTWGAFEANLGANESVQRLGWWTYADASGGFTVYEVTDPDAAVAFTLESSVALGEFLEIECRPVLGLDAAMGPIVAGVARKDA
jgi:hypothetical protein